MGLFKFSHPLPCYWYFLEIDWRRQWHPIPVLLPGKSHARRNLVGCSWWGHEESDSTERLHFHFSLSCIEEGNGNPLQCSCLENPGDGGARWAAVYGVAQSWTRLTWLSCSSRNWWFSWLWAIISCFFCIPAIFLLDARDLGLFILLVEFLSQLFWYMLFLPKFCWFIQSHFCVSPGTLTMCTLRLVSLNRLVDLNRFLNL